MPGMRLHGDHNGGYDVNEMTSPLTPSLFLLTSPFLLMVSPDKIAVCLSCGNEWEVRTAGIGKKRKCPLCGKYKVKMKSELKDDEKPPAAPPPVEEKTGEKEENTGEPEEEEEKEGKEKKEHSGGRGFITYAALLLLAIGAGWFLISVRRRRRAPPVDTGSDEVERYQRFPAFPGF